MALLKTVILFLCFCMSCFGQADFRFYVFDEIKNKTLSYTFVEDIVVYDNHANHDPSLHYRTEYRVSGVNQKEFKYTTESYQGSIPRAEYVKLMDEVKKLSTKGLDESDSSYGWLSFNGKSHTVTAEPSREARKLWKSFLDQLLKAHAPVEKRNRSTKVIQGDVVQPVGVTFGELSGNPDKYDGKRVRVKGFHHFEFEDSSFAQSEEEVSNTDKALWLCGDSSFSDTVKVNRTNDSTLIVEGVFKKGAGGHLGLWMGELTLVTSISKVSNDNVE